MAVAARKYESHAATPRPNLRLVRPHSDKKPATKRARRVSHAAAHQAFVFFAVSVVAIAVLGVGRVWLSVQATQASIDSTRLRQAIKNERYRGDLLEVQQSALATPSRILAIANGTLGMAPATSVTYLRLTDDRMAMTQPVTTPTNEPKAGMLERAMDIAAGEAQILLVGDVGLSTSR